MSVASTLPANTCQRSTERVRIVFSVPLWSSVATMSPATSAVISGSSQNAPKARQTSGTAKPVSRTKLPNGSSSGPPLLSAASAMTKISGTASAAPRPMKVRFWASSLRSSQR